MSRIFLSHSSTDNAPAIALRDWLVDEGWNDLFLDLDPEHGIAAGERWERALNEAASRCEAVLFLISKAWLGSRWCINELSLARRLNKRLFGVLIEEGVGIGDLPRDVTRTWQVVNLSTGQDHKRFHVTLPITGEEHYITFSLEGLSRLRTGLLRAGLHASYFAWPPEHDPMRRPYRGLLPLEGDDAGIFFGREAPLAGTIDRLRELRGAAPPRLLVLLGASGAGKSSFLRAGLLPRLARDYEQFLLLPVIRPERAALFGENGLLQSLARAFQTTKIAIPRGELRGAIQGGATALTRLLNVLVDHAMPNAPLAETRPKPPTLVISVDQCEELFLADVHEEAETFLALLRDLLVTDNPAMIGIFTIRPENYERLQTAPELEGLHQQIFSLPPMPKGAYVEVIKGPARRLDGTARALRIDDALVQELLTDVEAGDAKNALPLLAFTLQRLYDDYGTTGQLKLEHYNDLGRIKGSIEAAVDRALKEADNHPGTPRDRKARLALLRRGLIPWLAGIDPVTGAPRRRVARLSEIPTESRPLIDLLVNQRLLATDLSRETGEQTIEPVHEAVLRQWGLLQGWLQEDMASLRALEIIKRDARDWAANGCDPSWLSHRGKRLQDASTLMHRPDLQGSLEPIHLRYLDACQHAERQTTTKHNFQGSQPIGYPSPQPKGTKIFISYRREDTKHVAGRIYDALKREFSDGDIFFDVDTIPFGTDFRQHIDGYLRSSAAVLVIIGPRWINKSWTRKSWFAFIPNQVDFVLAEIEYAFELGVPIVPILVDDTSLPSAYRLPTSIKGLLDLNAAQIRGGRDFSIDVKRLVDLLKPLRDQGRR